MSLCRYGRHGGVGLSSSDDGDFVGVDGVCFGSGFFFGGGIDGRLGSSFAFGFGSGFFGLGFGKMHFASLVWASLVSPSSVPTQLPRALASLVSASLVSASLVSASFVCALGIPFEDEASLVGGACAMGIPLEDVAWLV